MSFIAWSPSLSDCSSEPRKVSDSMRSQSTPSTETHAAASCSPVVPPTATRPGPPGTTAAIHAFSRVAEGGTLSQVIESSAGSSGSKVVVVDSAAGGAVVETAEVVFVVVGATEVGDSVTDVEGEIVVVGSSATNGSLPKDRATSTAATPSTAATTNARPRATDGRQRRDGGTARVVSGPATSLWGGACSCAGSIGATVSVLRPSCVSIIAQLASSRSRSLRLARR